MAADAQQPVEIVQTKRKTITVRQTPSGNERGVREMLARKVSGSCAGMWLLIPELQRLGAWQLLKGWTGGDDRDLDPRIALHMVCESALCTPRVRRKNSLSHQGFSLAAGLAGLISDRQVHRRPYHRAGSPASDSTGLAAGVIGALPGSGSGR